jgi:Bacterial Ig domain
VVRRTVYIDNTAPSIAVTTAPKNNAKLTKKVTLKTKASDTYGVAKVQLLVNGKVAATDMKAGYEFTLNPKNYGKTFTVQMRATRQGPATCGTPRSVPIAANLTWPVNGGCGRHRRGDRRAGQLPYHDHAGWRCARNRPPTQGKQDRQARRVTIVRSRRASCGRSAHGQRHIRMHRCRDGLANQAWRR